MKNFYFGKKVLVTGGCGFIGSHLAERLVTLGADVTILDNLFGGNLSNIEHIRSRVNFVCDTIENYDVCRKITHDKEIIFHLAAMVSVPESIEKPDQCHKINVDGTINLLESARINRVERFVFSSSAAVYGNREDRCKEVMPVNPLSPYGFSKHIGELYCRQYALLYKIKTRVMRYFNVYGSRQNPKGAYAAVFATFDHCMRSNKPITIFGDGLQTRDFIPVERVVEANLIMGMHHDDQLNGQPINIATGTSITLLDVIEQLRQRYPTNKSMINFKPARMGDIRHSSADSTKYRLMYESLKNEIQI